MRLSVAYDFLPKQPSSHAAIVMDHFGIGFETGRHVIAEDWELPVQEGDVVCFTGSSGSGKSSLMRAAARELDVVLDINELELGEAILIDALGLPVQEALAFLSTCGLGEAQLLLRTPQELSDGQRYRFRLALALARKPAWVFADEFTATLDRTLARVIAFNIRRLADRTGTGFLLATTHEDILEDLQPSLHVQCRLDGQMEWTRGDVKKNAQPRPGVLDQSGHQVRLAVLRSVALPKPQPRLRPLRDFVVGRRGADRYLCVHVAGDFATAAQPILWFERTLVPVENSCLEQPNRHAFPCGDSSHLSRGRRGGALHPP